MSAMKEAIKETWDESKENLQKVARITLVILAIFVLPVFISFVIPIIFCVFMCNLWWGLLFFLTTPIAIFVGMVMNAFSVKSGLLEESFFDIG